MNAAPLLADSHDNMTLVEELLEYVEESFGQILHLICLIVKWITNKNDLN